MDPGSDRDQKRSSVALGDSPFTDPLERALAVGEIDVAVHSLGDLPIGATTEIAREPHRNAGTELMISAVLARVALQVRASDALAVSLTGRAQPGERRYE